VRTFERESICTENLTRYCIIPVAVANTPVSSFRAITASSVRSAVPAFRQRLGQCGGESFFSSLKTERTARKMYRSRDEARADVFDYIERFYNRASEHPSVDVVEEKRLC
jgi:Integrase core domain